jgi:hypothetical protein
MIRPLKALKALLLMLARRVRRFLRLALQVRDNPDVELILASPVTDATVP